MDLSQLDLARLQFAMTSIYHFLFVPVTIGTALLVADPAHAVVPHRATSSTAGSPGSSAGCCCSTSRSASSPVWCRSSSSAWTGRQYSRFVGDVFGAPLAMEGLAAFFLESTFLGVWVFGWKVLPRGVHLASAWLVALGTVPVGDVHHRGELVDAEPGRLHDSTPRPGRPVLSSIGDVFTNPVFLPAYVHVARRGAALRQRGHARRLRLAPAPRQRGRRCSTGPPSSASGCCS